MSESLQALKVGSVLTGPQRTFTLSRRRWYSSGLRTAGTGTLSQPMMGGIHDDDEYARGQGMKAPIIDGMSVTNWCSSLLVRHFGIHYVARGDLRTKYIKPTYLGDRIAITARIIAIETDGARTRYSLDIWCENQDGVKVTDGDAVIVAETS